MSKYGLGRGLSSLFATYEEAPKKEEKQIVKQKEIPAEKPEVKQKKPDADEIIQRAREIISTKPTSSALKDIDETVERNSYLEEREILNQKLSKIEAEMPTHEVLDGTVREIDLKLIDINTNQPRKNFDKESLQELSDSIKQHGVIQPIIVIQKGDRYSIVAGERRYRASKIAGLKTIPAIIKDYTTRETKEIALIENLQREDLNPVETAYALKQLIEEYHFTHEDLASKIGKTSSVVSNYMRILRLEPEVLSMIEKGKLTFAHAKALISIPDREIQIKLARKACDDKISSRELENITQAILNPEKAIKKKETVGLEIKNLVNTMQYIFGTKVNVIGSDKRGRIYIDYFNGDDLDRIKTIIDKLR